MKQYADVQFYQEEYLQGRPGAVPDKEFPYWSMLATTEIRNQTFDRVDKLSEIPDEVQMCCCEVAEKLYQREQAKSDNGMILQSYGNDGETAAFKTDDLTESAIHQAVDGIIRRWLSNTGLMYRGV